MPAVEGFYHDMWDSRSSLVELEIDLCSADDWGVACEGAWKQQCPGESLAAQGRDVDKDAWYLASSRLAWFFPFEEIDGEMRLVGEIIYGDDDGMTFTKMARLVGGRKVDYPHAIEQDGFLYVAFASAKQTVEVLKIRVSDLQL